MAELENALTTLSRVKDELDIDSANTESDDVLKTYINEASDFINEYVNWAFVHVEGYEETLGGSADHFLVLRHRPIIKINSIIYDGEELDDYSTTTDDLKAGLVYRENGWFKSVYKIGLTGDQFGSRRIYTVNYDYGYILPEDATTENPQTLPRSIEAIVARLAINKFKETQRDSYGLEQLKQGRLTYRFSKESFSSDDLKILNRYKSVGVW